MSVTYTSFVRNAVTCQMRIADPLNEPYRQSDIAFIEYGIANHTNDDERVITGSLVVAEVIFNALQPWSVDGTGYNFSATFAADNFTEEPAIYEIEVEVVDIAGIQTAHAWRVKMEHRPNLLI